MKKFLAFFTATVLLFAGVFLIYWKYVRPSEYMVFVQSFGHGVITVDSKETVGTDEKYRVTCDNGQELTLNINPERTDSTYYNLKKLIVNGVNVTDEVNMLQYKVKADKKLNVLAFFKKGKRPEIMVKIFPFAASFFSFLCLILANFECPDICFPLSVFKLKYTKVDRKSVV